MKLSFLMKRLDKLFRVVRSKKLLRALITKRVLAGIEHRHVLESNFETVVDIGANRGQFALAVKKFVPNARIIAFEPLNDAATTFRHVFKNVPAVNLYQVAISPGAGETNMHVAAADDSSSLLPISPLQERLFPGTGEIRTELVKVCPLSHYVAPEEIVPPAMLKLDVQGYELEALRGCEALLPRFYNVYAECSFIELYSGQALADEIIAWLRKRGFLIRSIHNMTYDSNGKSIQADLLFVSSNFSINDERLK